MHGKVTVTECPTWLPYSPVEATCVDSLATETGQVLLEWTLRGRKYTQTDRPTHTCRQEYGLHGAEFIEWDWIKSSKAKPPFHTYSFVRAQGLVII